MQQVYLIQENASGSVKIGMTKSEDVQSRLMSMQTYSPMGCSLLFTILCEDASLIEKKLHKKYEHKRLNGEFFKLSEIEIAQIRSEYKTKPKITDSRIDVINAYLASDEKCEYKVKQIDKYLRLCVNTISKQNEKSSCDKLISDLKEKYSKQPLTKKQEAEKLHTTEIISLFGNDESQRKISSMLKEEGYYQKMERIDGNPIRVWHLYPTQN